jgi:hypothetical protein
MPNAKRIGGVPIAFCFPEHHGGRSLQVMDKLLGFFGSGFHFLKEFFNGDFFPNWLRLLTTPVG